MKTVGIILRGRRLEKQLTLPEVERATKIRQKFLEAIESDEFSRLPSAAYAKGFVKNYSDFLGLNSDHTLAFFRRQMQETPRSTLLPRGMSESLTPMPFQMTPGKFLTLIIVCMLSLFLLYFGVQYRRLHQPPKLVIVQPKNESMTIEKRIELSGQTDTDATVSVNGVSVIVRSDGTFFDQIALEPGVNTISVIATSRYGKTATKKINIGLQALTP